MFFLDKFNPIEEYWHTPTNHKYKERIMNEVSTEAFPTELAIAERKRFEDEKKRKQEADATN